jgi:hypothetical protein
LFQSGSPLRRRELGNLLDHFVDGSGVPGTRIRHNNETDEE